MIPKIVHQTFRSKDLPFEERQLRKRIARLMPAWELRLWDDGDNDDLIGTVFPEYIDQFRQITRGVVKADICRLVYLFQFGGFYMDTDYKLLRPIEDDILQHRCVLPISRGDALGSDSFRICNSVFGSERGYGFWADFVRHLFDNYDLSNISEHMIEKVTGPEGLTDFYVSRTDKYPDVYRPSRGLFHPLITMKGLSYQRGHQSYGAHLCWGSWRSKSVLRDLKTLAVRRMTCF
jgi:mannosyltransferase OCH1-like enzyme